MFKPAFIKRFFSLHFVCCAVCTIRQVNPGQKAFFSPRVGSNFGHSHCVGRAVPRNQIYPSNPSVKRQAKVQQNSAVFTAAAAAGDMFCGFWE